MLAQLGFLFSNAETGAENSGFGWSQILAFGVGNTDYGIYAKDHQAYKA